MNGVFIELELSRSVNSSIVLSMRSVRLPSSAKYHHHLTQQVDDQPQLGSCPSINVEYNKLLPCIVLCILTTFSVDPPE